MPCLPKCSILIESSEFLSRVFDIFPGLHPHVKDRTISTRTDDTVVHTTLTTLTLSPQTCKSNFQLCNLRQLLLVKFPKASTVISTHRAILLLIRHQRLLATHACLRLLCELHQA